jgi:Sulfotransferase family
MSAAREPPFFIVGSARSGTTMLRLMLNAHPAVAVPPESRFIVELWRGRREVRIDTWLQALSDHHRFQTWQLPIERVAAELDGAQVAPYAEAVAAAYRAYASERGKRRWGDKTPRYIEHIPLLADLFGDARFVHLVRDGRDVALSYADVPFGPKTVAKAADLWATRVRRGIEAGRALGPGRYTEVRYEDLVSDESNLVAKLREMCELLELEYSPAMLEYDELANDEVLARASLYNPNVTRSPMARTRSWETDMPAAQVEVFEAVAGEVLSDLGYARRYAHPRPRARLEATLARLGAPLGRLGATRR